MAGRSVIIPTDEEDAAINRGIAEDPDTVVWTEAEFASAVRGAEAGPAMVPERLLRRRGPQKAPTKEMISLRLDRDVLDRWRATGPGWQGRVNEVLRKALVPKDPARRRKA